MSKTPKFPVRELKFSALTKFAHDDWNLPKANHPSLETVSQNLKGNAARVRFLILLPTQIAGAMAITQRAQDLAEYDLTGTLSQDALAPEIASEVEKRRIEMLQAHAEEELKKQGTPDWDVMAGNFHIDAARSLLGLSQNPLGALMLLGVFPSTVIGAWTAIETMLGDLWEAALNAHPKTLATLNGKPKRGSEIQNPKTSSDQERKAIDLNLVALNEFDLRNTMGTLFRRERRFEFARLSGAREAYLRAFSEKASRIDTAVSSKSLDALSAVRNIYVHKGGIADAEYAKRASVFKIPKADPGSVVHLDGEIVADLVGNAFASAKSLFVAVDDWIVQN
jgi:hypothetical protein